MSSSFSPSFTEQTFIEHLEEQVLIPFLLLGPAYRISQGTISQDCIKGKFLYVNVLTHFPFNSYCSMYNYNIQIRFVYLCLLPKDFFNHFYDSTLNCTLVFFSCTDLWMRSLRGFTDELITCMGDLCAKKAKIYKQRRF